MLTLLTEILSSAWLISDERKDAYAAILLSMLNGERVKDEESSSAREKNRSYVTSLNMADRWSLSDPQIPEGSIAVIPIRSEIMKYDQMCGPRGSVSIQKDIQAADRNAKIKSILLVIDSPGGQVTHTDLLADTIKQSSTPVIAYVEGMAASAAYWIASAASKIVASSDLDRVGSIGTMLFFADLKPYYEEMGVKFHEIYATKSKDKNKDYNDILEGKYDAYRTDTLDFINDKFHAAVQNNRKGLDKSVLTGKMYFATEAISLGLIDEIGTFDHALAQADAVGTESITLKTDTMKIKMLSVWTAIATFFNWKEDEVEGKELTEDMIGQLNDKLADLTAKNAGLETSFNDERAAKVQLQEDIAAKDTLIGEANAAIAHITEQYEALKNQDGGEETIAGKSKDELAGSASEPVFGHDIAAKEFLGE